MLPYVEYNMPLNKVLQQDNDRIHISKMAKKLFPANVLEVLVEWLASSPFAYTFSKAAAIFLYEFLYILEFLTI